MASNAGKQQVQGITTAVLCAWGARRVTSAEVAKDQGGSRYGYGVSNPELNGKVEAVKTATKRIRVTGVTHRSRCNIGASLHFGL